MRSTKHAWIARSTPCSRGGTLTLSPSLVLTPFGLRSGTAGPFGSFVPTLQRPVYCWKALPSRLRRECCVPKDFLRPHFRILTKARHLLILIAFDFAPAREKASKHLILMPSPIY